MPIVTHITYKGFYAGDTFCGINSVKLALTQGARGVHLPYLSEDDMDNFVKNHVNCPACKDAYVELWKGAEIDADED